MTAVREASRVDVGALTATVRNEACARVASALTSALVGLEDGENGLNELQQAQLFESLLGAFDGFERSVAGEVVERLQRNGVEVWGLPTELKDLIRDA